MPLPKMQQRYTVQDYMTWPESERWEIIDGIAYDMSPAPLVIHQRIVLRFASFFDQRLQGNKCTPHISPIDVILSEEDVVQPDVLVIYDPKKITPKNIQGAPDLVIEILSPFTSTKDQREKKYLYEKYGVREYLIVDPEAKHVVRFCLSENSCFDRGEIFDAQQILPLRSLENLEISLWDIFEVERIVEVSDTEG